MKKNFTSLSILFKKGTHIGIISIGLLTSIRVLVQLPRAQQVTSQMKVGWNMENTLEAICRENLWRGDITTQKLIDSLKTAAFNTVRLPIAWFCSSDTNNSVIDGAWLVRVKEVVDCCIKGSLYVIINIHWDNCWFENRVNTANHDHVNERQDAYWTQTCIL